VLVATAATLGSEQKGSSLGSIGEIARAITPFLGEGVGTLVFALGICGAAIVTTIVVTLAAARTLSEMLGFNHLLEHKPREAPWLYGTYAVLLIAAALFIISGVDLVALSIDVQVMNALFLPLVLGFLFVLARRLPGPHRLDGAYASVVAVLLSGTAALALFTALVGILDR
jgi:Mn2+/Fe2+ NRAMP family transporter